MNPTPDVSEFEALLEHLKRNRCFDFSGYKRSCIEQAYSTLQTVQIRGCEWISDGTQRYLDIEVLPVTTDGDLVGQVQR